MSIYVDRALIPHERMKMPHLLADTPEELRQAAVALGLSRYIQYPGTPKEHLDVSMTKRTEAIERLGAKQVSGRTLVKMIRARAHQEAG